MNRSKIFLTKGFTLIVFLFLGQLNAGTASAAEALLFENRYLSIQSYQDLVSIRPANNGDVLYHTAFKSKNGEFEIRVRYEPMAGVLEKHAESKKPNSKTVVVPANNMFQMTFMVCMMNILQSENAPRMTGFPPKAVKEEFNADAGLTSFGQGKSQFLGKYSFVLAYAIHKSDIGDVHVYYLFNDPKKGQEFYRNHFYPVKFK
jgi:hypothetical protein